MRVKGKISRITDRGFGYANVEVLFLKLKFEDPGKFAGLANGDEIEFEIEEDEKGRYSAVDVRLGKS